MWVGGGDNIFPFPAGWMETEGRGTAVEALMNGRYVGVWEHDVWHDGGAEGVQGRGASGGRVGHGHKFEGPEENDQAQEEERG